MANTDFTQISIVEEVAEGVLPVSSTITTPVMQLLNKISITPNHGKQYSESPESRGDRLDIESDLIATDPTYQMSALLRYGVYDQIIASCLKSDWVRLINRENRVNLNLTEVNADASAVVKQITSVTASTDTLAITTGTPFPPQALVDLTGFSEAANNQVIVADAASDATSLIAAGGVTLADETPPNGAKAQMIGVEGDTGEIIATSDGLTWTGFDWADYPVVEGMWLAVGGVAAGNRFNAHVLANGAAPIMYCRIARGGIDGADLTFDRKPSNWAADTGTGKQIRVFFFEHVGIGSTAKTFGIQVLTKRRRASDAIRRFTNLHGALMSLSGAARDRISLDVQLRGPNYQDSAANLNSGALAATENRSFLTRRFGQIFADGTQQRIPVATGTVVINPNLLPAEEWGFDAFGDYDAATQMTMFQGELQFESDYARDKFHGEAFGDLTLPWERDGRAYIWEFPKYQFTELSESYQGKGSLIKQQFGGKGVANADGSLNTQFLGWRCPWLEKRAA